MSASSDKSRPSELSSGGLSAVPSNDGRTIGVLALIFGVGGLLMSWMIVGGILGAFGIVLGIIAMAKATSAKKRVQSAGGDAVISGSFGLGIVGIVTGIAAAVVSLMLYSSTSDAMSKCEKFERTSGEYAECISNQMGTDQPKKQSE